MLDKAADKAADVAVYSNYISLNTNNNNNVNIHVLSREAKLNNKDFKLLDFSQKRQTQR